MRKPDRKLRRKVRQVFESALICVGFLTFPWLPRAGIMRLSRVLGWLGVRVATRLRRIAYANLDLAYQGRLSAREKQDVVRACFRTSALLLLDVFWFSAFTKNRLERYVRFAPSMDPYLELAPLVGVTAHIGNWEVCGLALALRGAPMLSIAAPLNNRFADRILNRTRLLTGQKVASRKGAVRAMLGELRKGGRVGLLMDQNVTPRNGGEFVQFFGFPVPVSRVAASLSARSGAPIMVIACRADASGCYELKGCAPIVVGDGGVSEGEATQVMTADVEKIIRETPGQWSWMYKRWRYVPEGSSMDGRPFYAEWYKSQ